MADETATTQEATATAPEISAEELAIQELEKDVSEDALEASEGGEAENTEPAKTEPAPEAQEDDNTSKTQLWSRITQQDKTIRELKQQMKSASSLDSIKEQAHKDPSKFLESIGFGVDQVLDVIAGQQGQPQVQKPAEENSEVSVLKKEIADMRKYFDEQKQISLVTQEVNHIDATIKTDPDRWEVINAMKSEGSYNLVIETASELYKQTGKIHDYEFVLDAVETHLAEDLQTRYAKLSNLKKLKAQEKQEAVKTPAAKPAGKSQPAVNPNSATRLQQEMSDDEKVAYAVKLLEAEDKK